MTKLGTGDYPLAEKRPELVEGRGGRKLDDITMAAVLDGSVGMEDLRIAPAALRQQAEIARSAGREALARNFERAAELADVPQPVIMDIYELLRPGRTRDKTALLDAARSLRDEHAAPLMAEFVEEAAEVYERRGLFTFRY